MQRLNIAEADVDILHIFKLKNKYIPVLCGNVTNLGRFSRSISIFTKNELVKLTRPYQTSKVAFLWMNWEALSLPSLCSASSMPCFVHGGMVTDTTTGGVTADR